ncbi:hypothetical protein [Fodinicola acaciae]|uniref:hypothetical protein n=1 Tax=Fodinicola acaciae TaxID=2681555 RepID=UPI0013D117ED|nr:hypothetical protein [Fodinicola acaciae]
MSLGDAADRLSRLDPRLAFRAGQPSGAGWIPLAEAADPRVLERWIGARARAANVATARVALHLAARVVRPLMALLHLENCLPVATAERFFVHRDGASFDALAIDADAYEPARLPRVADQLCQVFTPIYQGLRRSGRYGLGPMWGGLLDMVGATSMLVARIGDVSRSDTWHQVETLNGLIEERIRPVRPKRPRCVPVALSAGQHEPFTVKGTCCLKYRETGLRVGQLTDTTAYCKTCPHIPDGVRQDRCRPGIVRDLERHHIAVS